MIFSEKTENLLPELSPSSSDFRLHLTKMRFLQQQQASWQQEEDNKLTTTEATKI